MTKEWFSAADLAGLPGIGCADARNVRIKADREGWQSRPRAGRGGGYEYSLSSLPAETQAYLIKQHGPIAPAARVEEAAALAAADAAEKPVFTYDAEQLWQWAATRSQKQRDKGAWRARLLMEVMTLMETAGLTFLQAAEQIARAHEISAHNLKNWYYGVNNKPGAQSFARQDWAAALISGYTPRPLIEIPTQAWDWFCSYWLTRERPSVARAYRRTVEVAQTNGWGDLPCERTFLRRTEDIPLATRIYLREGPEALAKVYPPQRRDRTMYAAGEAVVGDGLKFDSLWISFQDGEVLNTVTGWFWSDLRTNYIPAYRLAKTENTDLFRLATYDLTAVCAPKDVWIDNTVVAANKAMTGRAPGRHRFHDRANDPIGLLLQLDMNVRFTNPDREMGSPGAKPIERSFGIGGLHEMVRTHPKLLGRGFSKATAIPFEEFAHVVAEEVARFNAQPKRRTAVCRGVLSYEQAWQESYSQSAVRKLSDAQRDLLLLMPEVVRANKRSGEIALKAGRGPHGKPRYWAESLAEYQGHELVAYYDPANLQKAIAVYTLDGRFVCRAERLADVAFNDTATAREWAKHKQRYIKANKLAATAQRRMSDLELAAAYPSPAEVTPPEPGIVQGVFGARKRVVNGGLVVEEEREDREQSFQRSVAYLREVVMKDRV